jgi:capsular polysaccharide biosynthesis protein
LSRTLVIGAGSCIMQALLAHFRTINSLEGHVDFVLSQNMAGGRAKVPDEELARCAILIEEAAPWQGSGTLSAEERAVLPASCITVTIPTLHFNSLWPLMTQDPRNVPETGAPYGRIPFGMGDRIALKIVKSVKDPSARRAAYDATELPKTVNIARSHELEVRNFFAREQGCDVRVAAYVLAHFRETRLFYTHAHPTGELVYFMLAQLFAIPVIRDLIRESYEDLMLAARRWIDAANIFRGEEAPVHPAVAEHFGLKWWHRDMNYTWQNQVWTFNSWIDWYLTYDPQSQREDESKKVAQDRLAVPADRTELTAGPWLNALIDSGAAETVVSVAPAALITRNAFVVRGDIDTTRARFGSLFEDPAYRSYKVAETVVAKLTEAAVLGWDGVVIHENKVVSDTKAHIRAGAAAPAVREVRGDVLILQRELQHRRLAGQFMVGCSGLWDNHAHWLLDALPRLVAFKAAQEQVPKLKLILPPIYPNSLQGETLEMLRIGADDIQVIAMNEVITCDEVFLTPAFDFWSFSPFCVTAARTLVTAAGADSGRGGPPIFLHRPGGPRELRNWENLAGALHCRGFQLIDPESLSVRQVIRAVHDASVVVLAHGDVLADTLFCRPGATVLELFNPACVQPAGWSMAACAGINYGYLIGSHVPNAQYSEPDWNSDFEVPIASLTMALDKIGVKRQPEAAHNSAA